MKKLILPTLALLLLPTLAHAHPGHEAASGFTHGFGHPIGGLDHILAMVAVGLWAAQIGGRALWAIPLTFVSVMAVGGALGVAGVPVPFIESGILASVLILGLFIAFAVRIPLVLSATLVGLFAICHGHAHGAEMPLSVSGVEYGLGFMLATALLHGTGILGGILIERTTPAPLVRFAGAAIAVAGLTLFFV